VGRWALSEGKGWPCAALHAGGIPSPGAAAWSTLLSSATTPLEHCWRGRLSCQAWGCWRGLEGGVLPWLW